MQAAVGTPICRYRPLRLRMKIRVNDPSDLSGLIDFLQRRDYVAQAVGPNTIEVSRLASVRHDLNRSELDFFLHAWHSANPEAQARFVE